MWLMIQRNVGFLGVWVHNTLVEGRVRMGSREAKTTVTIAAVLNMRGADVDHIVSISTKSQTAISHNRQAAFSTSNVDMDIDGDTDSMNFREICRSQHEGEHNHEQRAKRKRANCKSICKIKQASIHRIQQH